MLNHSGQPQHHLHYRSLLHFFYQRHNFFAWFQPISTNSTSQLIVASILLWYLTRCGSTMTGSFAKNNLSCFSSRAFWRHISFRIPSLSGTTISIRILSSGSLEPLRFVMTRPQLPFHLQPLQHLLSYPFIDALFAVKLQPVAGNSLHAL